MNIYRASQEKSSVFWEVIISVILIKKNVYTYMCPIPKGFRDSCTDQQHAMSSHEFQSSLMLTVEFSNMCYTK
jgi:hypothetical protein